MEKKDIVKKLESAVAEKILNNPEFKIELGDALITSGLIDSFSLVDLALIVEELFSVRIEDYELNSDSFDNLNQLSDLILQKLES